MQRTPRTIRHLAVVTLTASALTLGAIAAPVGAASASSDEQIAKAGVVVAKDVPSSWKSTPPDPDSAEAIEALAAGFPECADYLDSRSQLQAGANAESRQFTSPKDEAFSNETWAFARTSTARSAFDAMGASTNAACLTLIFQRAFEQQIAADPTSAAQVTAVRAAVQETSSVPNAGDDQIGYIGTVQITLTDGSIQQLLLGYFAVRTGRGILGYTIMAPPVGDGFSDAYAAAVENAIDDSAARMVKAQKK